MGLGRVTQDGAAAEEEGQPASAEPTEPAVVRAPDAGAPGAGPGGPEAPVAEGAGPDPRPGPPLPDGARWAPRDAGDQPPADAPLPDGARWAPRDAGDPSAPRWSAVDPSLPRPGPDAPWLQPAPYARRAVVDAFRLLVTHPRHFVAGALVVGFVDALLGVLAADFAILLVMGLASTVATVAFLAFTAALTRQHLETGSRDARAALRLVRARTRPLLAAFAVMYALPATAMAVLVSWGINAMLAGTLQSGAADGAAGVMLLLSFATLVGGVLLTFRFLYTVPAIVTDGLGFADAARASWRASGRRLRAGLLFAAVAGLAAAPAGALQVYILVPPEGADGATGALILLASLASAWLVYGITNPLEPIALAIAYRRLRIPNPAIHPVAPPSARRDQRARAILAALAVVILLGMSINAGREAELGAAGFAERGAISFGTGAPADAFRCRPSGPTDSVRTGDGLVWAAFLREPIGPAADIEMGLAHDGQDLGRSDHGAAEAGTVCLWGEEAAGTFSPGEWTLTLYVDEGIAASGTIMVTP